MMKKERFTRIAASSILALAVVAAGATMYRSEADKRDRERQEQEQSSDQERQEQSLEGESPQEDTAKHTEDQEKQEEASPQEAGEIGAEAEESRQTSGSGNEAARSQDGSEGETVGPQQETAPSLEENVRETAGNASGSFVENAPQVEFGDSTVISWPLQGSPVIDYSMDATVYFPTLGVYKYSPAMILGAAEGTPVCAAAAGTVESVVNDAEAGTMVTVDMGNGYRAIYGQLGEVSAEAGQAILEGEQLGVVAAPTKYYAEEGSNLYFAMTKEGEPVDPSLYLAPLTE